MKLSNREKLLLIILAAVLISYLYYNYLLTPQLSSLSELNINLGEKQQTYDTTLIQSSPNNKVYKDYKALNAQIEMMTHMYFPTLLQDKIILIINDMINKSGLNVSSISFTEPEMTSPEEQAAAAENSKKDNTIMDLYNEIMGTQSPEGTDKAADKSGSSDNSAQSNDKKNYSIEFMSATLNFEGSYNNIINFMYQIENYDKKIIINNVNLASGSSNMLNGSIALDFYAVPKLQLQDEEYLQWDLDNKYGKDDPFAAYQGYVKQESSAYTGAAKSNSAAVNNSKSDFIILVKPISSDLPTIIIGNAKENNSRSYVYADNPNIEDVEFNVFKMDGRYYYRYRTNSSSYPADYENELAEFVTNGKSIELNISSTLRNSDSDVSGMNIGITNNTDLPLNVNIINEDSDRPRVHVTKMNGNVKINK